MVNGELSNGEWLTGDARLFILCIASYTQSRAAILCFGGWGMQVMFHLLPRACRLRRNSALALGAIGPDLESITRFGALVPDALLDRDETVQFPSFATGLTAWSCRLLYRTHAGASSTNAPPADCR